MAVDGLLLGRKVNQAVDAKFPTTPKARWKLGFYAASRASQMRRMRAPRPQVNRGDKVDLSDQVRVLVLGGIRSGKSEWAESAIAASVGAGRPVRYLATGAVADDDAWAAAGRRPTEIVGRRTGRRSKAPMWQRNCGPTTRAATLVDDVGGWLTAAMDRAGAWTGGSVSRRRRRPGRRRRRIRRGPLVLVSPEVGLTVVPATDVGPAVRRRAGHAQPAARGAVRPRGAGGRGPAGHHREGVGVTDFPPIAAPDQDVAAAGARRGRTR